MCSPYVEGGARASRGSFGKPDVLDCEEVLRYWLPKLDRPLCDLVVLAKGMERHDLTRKCLGFKCGPASFYNVDPQTNRLQGFLSAPADKCSLWNYEAGYFHTQVCISIQRVHVRNPGENMAHMPGRTTDTHQWTLSIQEVFLRLLLCN